MRRMASNHAHQGTVRKERARMLAASTLLAAASCYAATDSCLQKHSEAWCILDAAGLSNGASDTTMQAANQFLADNKSAAVDGTPAVGSGFLVIGAARAANLTSPILGLSRGTSVGMDIVMALSDGAKPGQKLQLFMVMPESVASNADPRSIAEAAFVEAMSKHLGTASSTLVEVPRKATFGASWTERHYLMTGGARCGDAGCLVSASFFQTDSSKKAAELRDVDSVWAGEPRAHFWNPIYADAKPFVRPASDVKKQIFAAPEYVDLIKLLPPWFYLYLPGKVNLLVNSDQVRLLAR